MSQQQVALSKIAKSFLRYRKTKSNRSMAYPESLREMVLCAIEGGVKPGSVAQVAKISVQSIYLWRRSVPKIAARELKVVTQPEDLTESRQQPIARVHLSSGVQIELELCALTPALLNMLKEVIP